MRKISVVVLLILGAIFFSAEKVSAQVSITASDNFSVGFTFSGNILQGDFTSHPLFFSGDIFTKQDIFKYASLYAGFAFGALKTLLDQNELLAHPGFPEKIRTDYSNFQLYAAIPLLNGVFQQEIFFGGEFLHFDPESSTSTPLPATVAYGKNVLGFIVGAGFGVPISVNILIHAKLMFHLPATDYLDNFAAESNDHITTFGVGLTYTFRNSDQQVQTSSPTATEDTSKKSWDGKLDSDGDGISDDDEINKYHTDPHKADTDGDGLNDFQEIFVYRTDPNKPDTDGDGLYDGEEVNKYHTDPLSWDSDGDGLSDGYEVNISHTNPLNHDTDGDGIWDKLDKCPLVKGVPPDGCPAN